MRACKKNRRKAYKGAVLFTVLVVMVFMLILTVATIGLAGEASRRAYSNYFDHQTTSTARSVVDSVIMAMTKDENKDLAEEILDAVEGAGDKGVSVNVSYGASGSKNLGDGFGTVESLVFTYVGKDGEGSVADKYYNITGSGKNIIKVTAIVNQGGVRNSYSQYVIGDILKTKKKSSGGGLIALGGYSGSESPQLNAHSPAYINITSDFDIYDNNKNNVKDKDGKIIAPEKFSKFENETKFTSLLINSSMEMKSNGSIELSSGDGVAVLGNLYLNNMFDFNTGFAPTSSSKLSEIPYLYVKGAVDLGAQMRVNQTPHAQNPLNIYCGRFIQGGGSIKGTANIYCYNTKDTLSPADFKDRNSFFNSVTKKDNVADYAQSNWSILGGTVKSNLIDWVSGSLSEKYKTGNFCTNGNLYMSGKINVKGDVYVKGDLYINKFDEAPDISGNIYVEGKVVMLEGVSSGNNELHALCNRIFCDPDKFLDESGNKITAVLLDPSAEDYTKNEYQLDEKGEIKLNEKVPAINGERKFVIHKFDGSKLPANITAFTTGELKDPSDFVMNVKEIKDSMCDESGKYKGATNVSEGIISSSSYYVYKSDGPQKVKASTIYGTSAPSDLTTSGDVTYEGDDDKSIIYPYNAKITNSCMITGSFQRVNFYIKPSSSEKLWINLHNAYFSQCTFVIDDSQGEVVFFMPTSKDHIKGGITEDSAENIENAKKLYWDCIEGSSLPDYGNYVQFTGDCFMVSSGYYKHFNLDDEVNILKFPLKDDKDTYDDNNWMLANVSICSADDAKTLFKSNEDLTFTGDICMPGGTVYINKAGLGGKDVNGAKWKYPSKLTYETNTAITKPVGCFGSIIAHDFEKLNNEFDTFYIDDPDGGEPEKSGDGGYAWTPLPGYANF